MMIRKWCRQFIRWANDYGNGPHVTNNAKTQLAREPNHIDDSAQRTELSIYPATGGHIVQMNRYDRHTGHRSTQLYIINGDDDFGTSLSQIVMIERLSN